MAHERYVPETTYQMLRGEPVEDSYSQVVVSSGDKQVHIAGTVPINADNELVGVGDMHRQVSMIMENIGRSLESAGAEPSDVVRIRIYTTDVDAYLQEGHGPVGDFFGDELPTSTLLGVDELANPDYLCEIDATAVVNE